MGSSHLSIFLLINIPPQTTGNCPPHTFQPSLASSPMHPLMSTPSSIWLLFILIKQRPPKAKAPPPSLLFDASYFTSPSKQTNNSERNPDGSRPVHGVGEQWHHDLVVPLLYPWRERGQSRWRVGWHGSSCWLLCLCVLCFVFCTASKTTGVTISVIFWYELCFLEGSFVNHIMTWKKRYSCLAVGWNQSQITVSCVKMGTPTTTGKKLRPVKKTVQLSGHWLE